jgi:predicted outer membrane repeat protein
VELQSRGSLYGSAAFLLSIETPASRNQVFMTGSLEVHDHVVFKANTAAELSGGAIYCVIQVSFHLSVPRGGVRPFHPKSTCLSQLNWWPNLKQICSRSIPNYADKTLVATRVDINLRYVSQGLVYFAAAVGSGNCRW